MDWKEIAASKYQTLIESMSRRVQAVLKVKGGYTKYQYIVNICFLSKARKLLQ